MDVEPRVLVQPLLHGRVFVRGVVVDDQVQIQVLGGLALDLLEKPQPFHMRVPRLGAREDLAVQIVQRREQGDRAVADVIVRPGANVADAQRQARLRPLQGLALALLVAAQYQSFVWRIQIQANHIPELALELGVLAQLERAPQVRLEVVLPPDTVPAVVRNPDGFGHRPHAPTAAAFGRLRHLCDHLLNLLDRQPGLAPAPGLVPQESVDTLTGVGKWVRANGESIYGTTASPFPEIPWGYSTVKGGTLYLHVFEWPKNRLLQLKGLRNKVIKVATLSDPEQALSFKQEAGLVEIKVPAKPLDAINSVLVMEIEGTAEVDPVLVTQREDGGYALDFLSAATQGAAVKRFNREGEWHISKWTEPSDGITWHIDVASPGEFEVRITYAANEGWVGQGYAIEADGTQLEAKVERTGDWYEYQTFSPGTLALAEAGEQTVRIVPKSSVPENLMYFKEMELVPAAQ